MPNILDTKYQKLKATETESFMDIVEDPCAKYISFPVRGYSKKGEQGDIQTLLKTYWSKEIEPNLMNNPEHGVEFISTSQVFGVLRFVHDTYNKFDSNAIKVYLRSTISLHDGWNHVGYVPKEINTNFLNNVKRFTENLNPSTVDGHVIRVAKEVDGKFFALKALLTYDGAKFVLPFRRPSEVSRWDNLFDDEVTGEVKKSLIR